MATGATTYKIPDEVVYDGLVLLKSTADLLPELRKLKTTPEDTFIAAYPKSGIFWISEIMRLIHYDGESDEKLSKSHWESFMNVDVRVASTGETAEYFGLADAAKAEGTPRFLRTWLPFRWIKTQIEDNGSKLVVVFRNVRDILVSFYNYYKEMPMFGKFEGTWDDFFEMFKDKHILYGDWLEHVREYHAIRHNANVHIVFYEDAVDDLKTTVEALAKFMGKSLPEATIDKIVQSTKFSTMKSNAEKIFKGNTVGLTAEHFRKGIYGSWKEYFTPEQDEYVKENYDKVLENIGLNFKF